VAARDSQSQREQGVGRLQRRQMIAGGGALFLAFIEGACLFVVSINGIGVLLSGSSLLVAGGASSLHSARVRIPLLAMATAGALINLYILWNAGRMRRSSAASWRMRPLTTRERRRNLILIILSLSTLLVVGGEVYAHILLHGSAL